MPLLILHFSPVFILFITIIFIFIYFFAAQVFPAHFCRRCHLFLELATAGVNAFLLEHGGDGEGLWRQAEAAADTFS